MAFQQKWIFLNKVLHEMKIEFPAPELVGRELKQTGQVLLSIRARGERVELSHSPLLTTFLTTECSFQGHG